MAVNRQGDGAHAPEHHGEPDPPTQERNHSQDAHDDDAHDHAPDQLPSLSGVAHQPLAHNCANHDLRAEQRSHPQDKS